MTTKEFTPTQVKLCPHGLLVCRESCPYWSCVASKCVSPALGADIDNNLSGDFHFGGGD
jgi:hypothetical protein